jgi:Trypsin-like peptidase domain
MFAIKYLLAGLAGSMTERLSSDVLNKNRCTRQMRATAMLAISVLGLAAMAHHAAPLEGQGATAADLRRQLRELTFQLEQLKQEQASPAVMLNRYRNSIGYIYGVYRVGFANQRPEIRARVSGTGFLVSHGLVVTNRHLAEPWYGDSKAEKLIQRGALASLETLVIFFPGTPTPVSLLRVCVSKDIRSRHPPRQEFQSGAWPHGDCERTSICWTTRHSDRLSFRHCRNGRKGSLRHTLLSYRQDDMHTAKQLAALSPIQPSTTYGYLGDTVGDKLIYDAPTAHGGSGGPVLNRKGEVIGVNYAYIDGFSGGTMGISVESLRPLLQDREAMYQPNPQFQHHPSTASP